MNTSIVTPAQGSLSTPWASQFGRVFGRSLKETRRNLNCHGVRFVQKLFVAFIFIMLYKIDLEAPTQTTIMV